LYSVITFNPVYGEKNMMMMMIMMMITY